MEKRNVIENERTPENTEKTAELSEDAANLFKGDKDKDKKECTESQQKT